MKTASYLLLTIATAALVSSCNKVSYRKTKTDLMYKIIPSGSKDSAAKPGNWIKFHFKQTLNNDSVLGTSFGKMPAYERIADNPDLKYNILEIFPLLKKGDSAVAIIFIDSLISKKIVDPGQLPPFIKKGDRLIFTLKVLDIFRNDTAYRKDAEAEFKRDQPRQEKEKEEETAKMQKQVLQQREKAIRDAEQSGEAAPQRKVVEDYLAAHHITAQKTGNGTYVWVKEQGIGPQVVAGKYATVKYTGKRMATDSVFQSSTYTVQVGVGGVIAGWDEGLPLFKEGGKGTIYIPGYLAYGKEPGQGSPFKPNDALLFDVEILKVSDKPDNAPPSGN